MERILISACLLGIHCRYDGKDAFHKQVKGLLKNKYVVFACPEQLGGLPTPRPRNHIIGERIINKLGYDVTKNFYRGAKEFIKIAKKFGVQRLYLKSKSPSCGEEGIVTKLLPPGLKVKYLK